MKYPLLFVMALLSACSQKETQNTAHNKINDSGGVSVWRDSNGCEYLVLYGNAITPRLDQYHRIICRSH